MTVGTRSDAPLALWGGFECSVARLGDTWRDQVRETGHHNRPQDLDAAAALGFSAIRAPFLWERCQDLAGWDWHDARMERLRRLGLGVVAGLVHHGAGPPQTSLLDPEFPAGLAVHAARVAERYPDITLWTPINEPLTTARFSCLYGIWHPHLRDDGAFLRAAANQSRATLLAMRAIRRIIPDARLLQTEDLARSFATAPVRAQAVYENERRWLSLDLLCGWVDRAHPWRAALERAGVPPSHLDELAEGEAAPDVIGGNHYVTSDRFLDHRTALYPPHLRGGNGHVSYADTEAVRAVTVPERLLGWHARLAEVWQRYRRPIVLSEAHLGCDDPIEQARWLMQAWRAATDLRADGADIRAVTVWALAGLVDWDSLMQRRTGRQEPGVISARGEIAPLLAQVLRALARDGTCQLPGIDAPGWWQRDERFGQQTRRVRHA